MKLSEKQQLFAGNVAKLISFVFSLQGYAVTLGEAYRPRETAAIYAKRGIGIKDSLHTQRLAIDLNLFIDGVYRADTEAYRSLGVFWKNLDPKNRWGGDFKDGKGRPKPDGCHFERVS